jgi:hypothetical protein
MAEPIDLPVKHLSRERNTPCILRIADAGVAVLAKKVEGGYPWEQVRRISFDDPGRTKANVGAIALFGVLGMASRRAFTLITVSTDDQELYFENEAPIGQWRASAPRIIDAVPAAAGRVWVDGAQVGAAAPASPAVPTAAGWYPDPLGVPRLRWHDGTAWTDHTAPAPPAPQ